MRSPRLFHGIALLVALVLIAAVVVGAPAARATANAPGWSVGDRWTFVSDTGQPASISVIARETVTLAGGPYDTFHTTWTVSGSITREEWIRMDDLGITKTLTKPVGLDTTTTYDPPLSQAVFPIFPGKQWSGTSTFRLTIGSTFISTGTSQVSGSVQGEMDLAVMAGTFHVYVVRNPAPRQIPTAYTLSYYSDSVGYWVKQENYNPQDAKTGEITLTSYSYQTAAIGTALLVALVVIVVVAVLVLLWWKRKQSLGRPGGPAAYRPSPPATQPYNPPSQPYNPPQQPRQGPP